MSYAFLSPYWTALMFWTEVSVGCLIVALLQWLTGGRWGRVSLPFLRAGMTGYFILLPFFLPAFLFLSHIFPWAGVPPIDLAARAEWLRPSLFLLRSVLYLAVFASAIVVTLRWRKPEPPPWAGPLLVGVIVTVSLASTDWMMSVDPGFASSLYPFVYVSGALVAVFAGLAYAAARSQSLGQAEADPLLLADFGKLLFAAILFWGYIELSQFLIIWTGNLPHEASWYLDRVSLGWRSLTVLLFGLHFFLPFGVLLSRPLKENPRRLALVAGIAFVIHYLAVFWLTAPRPGIPFRFDPFDVLLPLALGSVWRRAVRHRLHEETGL